MRSNQFFDFGRFVNTVKTDLLPKRKALSIAALAAIGLMLLLTFFGAFSDYRISSHSPQKVYDFFNKIFPGIAFLAGLFITAGAFRSLSDSRIAHGYLGLPASHFEKYLSKWLLTGPLYMLGTMVLIALTGLVAKLILAIYPGIDLDLGRTFQGLRVRNITGYLLPHALFLLGSIAFKRLAFWKTLLAMFASFLAWAIFTGVSFRIIFAKFFTGTSMMIGEHNLNFSGPEFFNFGPDDARWIAGAISLLIWATFNLAGYFKLKETEV